MLLGRKAVPFDHPVWLFEIKHDGFRALAFIRNGECTLVSRNGNEFKSFEGLRLRLPDDVRVRFAVLDGEIACLDVTGRSVFNDLFYRRREPVFVAFDVLSVNGEDTIADRLCFWRSTSARPVEVVKHTARPVRCV
jgi:bifunctional non-homologous end joining protein LigD